MFLDSSNLFLFLQFSIPIASHPDHFFPQPAPKFCKWNQRFQKLDQPSTKEFFFQNTVCFLEPLKPQDFDNSAKQMLL